MRRIAPVVALYFLAPLVAEYLLGDFPVSSLAIVLFLAPMYGAGAILIREVVRRTGRGWPSMLVLALAYGVFEEGITTQSLFDPNYADAHLLEHGFIPSLGIAVPWTLYVLSLHTVWSISVPIALIEGWTPERRTTPWLGRRGLIVTTVLFVLGSAATTAASYAQDHFAAPALAFIVVTFVVVALIVVAMRLPKARTHRRPGVTAPSTWLVVVATLAAGAVFEVGFDTLPTWLTVPAIVLPAAAMIALVLRWSTRPGWGATHRFALAAGALLTYAWHSFEMHPVVTSSATMTLVSHVVFAVAALALLAVALRRVRRLGSGDTADAIAASSSMPEAATAH